ncbi:MAG: alpha/beta fold hydrolase [Verrucomicrobia bacterium]|nr:alpha/beta fold hydrolase [Verrucomicrobiota bacterium]
MLISFTLLCFAATGPAHGAPTNSERRECVVLLHGLGRFPVSMKPIERDLRRAGYHVVNLSYPSWRVPVERIADDYLPRELARRIPAGTAKVHFVSHSLGGILLRQHLATHTFTNLGRVVMLGPPNRGSTLADWFKCCDVVRWVVGPNLPRLGTGPDDLPARLGPANFELGVIAGDRPLFGGFLLDERPNDSKVTVNATRIAGMKDHVVVHSSHTFMMRNPAARHQTVHFLVNGHFDRDEARGVRF